MDTEYAHLDHLSESQFLAWIVDTEPEAGRPTFYHAVRVEDAIECAMNCLVSLLLKINESNKATYTPNCRYHLYTEFPNRFDLGTDRTHPLGGIMDALDEPTDRLNPPPNLEEKLSYILPHPPFPRPTLFFWSNPIRVWNHWASRVRESLDGIFSEHETQKRPYLGDLPESNTSTAILSPWWKKYNPRNGQPYPPNKQASPKTTGNGVLAALGATNTAQAHLDGSREIAAAPESDTAIKDDVVRGWLQISTANAAELRQKTDHCKATATADIQDSLNWIKEVTTPHSSANKTHAWGMNSEGRNRYERQHKVCTWEDADKLITYSIANLLLSKWSETIRSQEHTEANPLGRYRDSSPIPRPYEQSSEYQNFTQDIKSQPEYCETCWYSLKCLALQCMSEARETLTQFILDKQLKNRF